MPRERMTKTEMVAELLREMGVLVLVFGFIDLVVPHPLGTTRGTPWWIAGIALGCMGLGVLLERIRRE